jgi:hypothetical protein
MDESRDRRRRERWLLAGLLLPAVAFVASTLPGVRANVGYDTVLDGWLNNIAYAAAPALCLVRLRSQRAEPRRAGILLAAALSLYGCGNIAWTVLIRPLPDEPFPSVADALSGLPKITGTHGLDRLDRRRSGARRGCVGRFGVGTRLVVCRSTRQALLG